MSESIEFASIFNEYLTNSLKENAKEIFIRLKKEKELNSKLVSKILIEVICGKKLKKNEDEDENDKKVICKGKKLDGTSCQKICKKNNIYCGFHKEKNKL
jgi:hypothetical protein